MGIVKGIFEFSGSAPDPDEIAEKASMICGHLIRFSGESPEEDDCMFYGKLFFDIKQDEEVELYAQRLSQYENRLIIDVQTSMISDLTLFNIAKAALVQLGGQFLGPGSDTAVFDEKLTEKELLDRFRKSEKVSKRSKQLAIPFGLAFILTLPIQLVVAVLCFPFEMIRMKRKIRANE